jgi:hypothetical protein
MTTTLQSPARTRKPATRGVRLTAPGEVVIRVGTVETAYSVTEVPCGGAFDGRGFRCHKAGADEPYDVFLSRNGADDTCDCKGFSRWCRCKHVAALRVLLSGGKLDDTPV